MSVTFIPPSQYLCMGIGMCKSGGDYLDMAFVPIPLGAHYTQCFSYIKENHCEIVSSIGTTDLLNMLGDHFPKKGRLIVFSSDGARIYHGKHGETPFLGEPFIEGDLLLCYRDAVYGMSDIFPKGPFTGKCEMVEAQEERY